MKLFKETITLNKNSRGCYILDTIKGCSAISKGKPSGCYNDCYAKNIAYRYNFDFSNIVKRDFVRDDEQLYMFNLNDDKHSNSIIRNILKIDMPFVRIGEMGDPSDDWKHTINVCKIISESKKPIVIITKHWTTITAKLLKEIEKLNICINTSISALDNNIEIKNRLRQFRKLKNHCNSVLRIVSCDFNKSNRQGAERAKTQDNLFMNDKIIDTIFRPGFNNQFVINKIINTEKIKFLKSPVLASLFNKNTYFGSCPNCPDMCGATP